MTYLKVPKTVSYNYIKENNYSLSSAQYKKILLRNSNTLLVRDFLKRKLSRKDLGSEVGSLSYINESPKYFMRTKALQSHSHIPDITKENCTPILPKSFLNMELKKGDLIISKDSNIGESIILDQDYPDIMLSGALYRLPVEKHKYYLFAFLKHSFFKEQIDFIVPKSATIRHAKTLFLECKIPLPSNNSVDIINYVELLIKEIINKEIAIKEKHKQIINLIESEITENQKENEFVYSLPRLSDLSDMKRIDASLYTEYFKKEEFKIKNYKNNYSNLKSLGFEMSRGQNLQISNIGKSINSQERFSNFYTIAYPKNFTIYGTIFKEEYLGNKNELKSLIIGDIIFGAEGFEKGRSFLVTENNSKVITNIHGITIHSKKNDKILSIFIKCFIDYLRSKGLIDLYAVGGNGGSLAQKYWDIIPFPNFPIDVQLKITGIYYNTDITKQNTNIENDNFMEMESKFNNYAGIIQLDKKIKKMKAHLDIILDKIINDEKVEIDFNFLTNNNEGKDE